MGRSALRGRLANEHRERHRAHPRQSGGTIIVRLTDDELALVMDACRPLPVEARDQQDAKARARRPKHPVTARRTATSRCVRSRWQRSRSHGSVDREATDDNYKAI
jgi:hypothetical protein